jgi:hypothetical protein
VLLLLLCLLLLVGKLDLHVRMDVQQHLLQLAQDQMRHDSGKAGGSGGSKAAASGSPSADELSEATEICWRHSLRVLLSSPIEPWQQKHAKQQSSLPGSSSLLGSGGHSHQQQQHVSQQQHAGGGHHHGGGAATAKHGGSSRAHNHHDSHHNARNHGSHAHGHKGSSRAAAAAAAAAAAGDMSMAAAQAAAAAGMFGPGMAGFPVLQGFPGAALLPNLAGLQALGAWPQGFAAMQQQQGWPTGMQQAPAMQQLQEQQLQQLASGQLGAPFGGPMAAAAAAAAAAMQRQQDQQQRQQQEQQGGLSSLPAGLQGMLGALPGSGADLYSQQMQAMAALSSQPLPWAAAGYGEAAARMN